MVSCASCGQLTARQSSLSVQQRRRLRRPVKRARQADHQKSSLSAGSSRCRRRALDRALVCSTCRLLSALLLLSLLAGDNGGARPGVPAQGAAAGPCHNGGCCARHGAPRGPDCHHRPLPDCGGHHSARRDRGTVEVDYELGVPVAMYTGVYLKTNAEAVAAHGLPPREHDPGTRFVEMQLLAVPADPDDPDLTHWVKLPAPAIALPPAGLNISCWRDPFCLSRPAVAGGEGDEWVILLASGIRGVGGAVLRFRSSHFTHGWRFDGILAQGDNAALGISGQDWECPVLTQLPATTRAAALAASSCKPQQPTLSSSRSELQTLEESLVRLAPGTPAVSSRPPISMSSLSNLGGSSASLAALASNSTSSSSASASLAADSIASPVADSSPATVSGSAAAALAAAASSSMACQPGSSLDAWVEQQTQQLQDSGHSIEPAGLQALSLDAAAAPDGSVCAFDNDSVVAGQPPLTPVSRPPHRVSFALEPAAVASTTASSSNSKHAEAPAWLFMMSPDACHNPITWWLGHYEGGTFDVAAADGPHRLDLGTTLYAATVSRDLAGRHLLYGWVQEHRRVPAPPALVDAFSYAGCICTPRVLQLVDGQLWQTPLPEVNTLRTSTSWHQRDLLLDPAAPPLPLRVVSGTHLDINVTLQPPPAAPAAASLAAAAASSDAAASSTTASTTAALPGAGQDDSGPCTGLVFQSWREGGKGAAVLAFHEASRQLVIEFDEPFPDAYHPHPHDTLQRRRVGGRLINYVAGEPLGLRVLLDGSAVEVFTSTGETLTTRMYRGHPPACACASCGNPAASAASASSLGRQQAAAPVADGAGGAAGIALFAAGAPVLVSSLDVWEMGCGWIGSSPDAGPAPPLLQQQQHRVAAEQQQERAGAAAQTDAASADDTQPEGEADADAEQAPCCREEFLQQLHIHS